MVKYTIFLFLLILSYGHGQIKFKHFTTQDGLPHDFTFELFQDEKGYIWIGTDDGLAKFNGINFKVFDTSNGLRSNYVTQANHYNKDTLLIGTWKGGLHFIKNDSIFFPKLKNDSVTRIKEIFAVKKDIFYRSSLLNDFIYKRSKGFSFSKQAFNLYQSSEGLVSPKKTPLCQRLSYTLGKVGDELYFYKGVHESFSNLCLKGIYQYKSDREIIPTFPFLNDKYINSFGQYNKQLFYATEGDLLYTFDAEKIIGQVQHDFGGNPIHFYAKTSYCEVFVVRNQKTGNDFIYVHDIIRNTWTDILKRVGSTILVSDMLVDKNENIWITSKADGLYKIMQGDSFFQPIVTEKEHIIKIMTSDDSLVFFHTLNKLYSYDDKSQNLSMKFFDTGISSFSSDHVLDNKIGIIPYHGSKFVPFLFFGKNVENSLRITKELDGKCFFFDQYSIWHQKSGEGTFKKTTPLLQNNLRVEINDIALVGDHLWVGTSSGIILFDIIHEKFHMYPSNHTVQKEWIKKICYQEGVGVWVVSTNGLSLVKNDGSHIIYNEDNGIGSNKINDITIGHFGGLWIGTQKGLSLLQGDMFYNFGIADQLNSSFVSCIKEDKNHQIWVGGNKGVVKIDNSIKPFQPAPPPSLVIKQKHLFFDIDVIDYSGKKVLLQYRLDQNEPWQDILSKQLDISRYSIGSYRFEFRARHTTSQWAYSDVFPVDIKQVWYKKTITIVLAAIIMALILLSLAHLRIRLVIKRNKFLQQTINQSIRLEKELSQVRENVAQDFHDELGNKLAGITILSQMMMKDKELMQSQSAHMISQVRKDADDLYFGIKDFVWSIDSKSDHLRELIFYLTDFGEDLFEPLKISYKVEKCQIEESQKLPYYWSRQLLLLFKEAMTNSFKHAEANEVILKFSMEGSALRILFQDNGKGFDCTRLQRTNGLANMAKRAQKIGGTLSISSENGTTILFTGVISEKPPQKGESILAINTDF